MLVRQNSIEPFMAFASNAQYLEQLQRPCRPSRRTRVARCVHRAAKRSAFERWERAPGESGCALPRVAEAAFGTGQYVDQQAFCSDHCGIQEADLAPTAPNPPAAEVAPDAS